MSVQVFTAVKKVIMDNGVRLSDDEIFLSELSLIESDEGESILFNALGLQCILLEDGSIAMVDETDPDDVEVSHFEDSIRVSLYQFLSWRVKFAREFSI